jgi:hypothetical protein
MELLEKAFLSRGLLRGGILLLDAAAAIAFVVAAETQRTRILGVESFMVEGEKVQPLLDHILDLSSPPSDFDSWRSARRFIEERASRGFLFEVSLNVAA